MVEVRDPGRRRRRGFGVADAQIATRVDRDSQHLSRLRNSVASPIGRPVYGLSSTSVQR